MDRSERMNMDFDIQPEQGVPLKSTPQPAEVLQHKQPEPVETEVDETEEGEVELSGELDTEGSEESPGDDTEATDDTQHDGIDMGMAEFATAVGLQVADIYHGIRIPDGRTLSQAIDETGAQRAAMEKLQTERDQLHSQLQAAQSNVVHGDDPEAMRFEHEAAVYQQQLDNADLSSMDAGDAANFKLSYMQAIQKLQTAAEAKRREGYAKRQQAAYESLAAANQELVSQVPEWTSAQVFQRDNERMANFLRTRGFSDQDLYQIDRSPKYKLLVRDAVNALAKQKEIKQGAKKIRKLSKSLKPGAKVGSSKRSLTDVRRVISNAGTKAEKQRARLSMEFDR